MYARRYYRRLPPNYSGVAFGGETFPRESGYGIREREDRGAGEGTPMSKSETHTKEIMGAALTPLIGDDQPVVKEVFQEDMPKRQQKDVPKAGSGFFDDCVLLSVLLILLSEGLEEESLLLLTFVLFSFG